MSEKVLFEYIADDGEGSSHTRVSNELKFKGFPLKDFCGAFFFGDEGQALHNLKHNKRGRRRVRRTLDMFEDLYDEIFGEEDSN